MIKAIIVLLAFLFGLPALALITIVLFAGDDDDYDPYVEKMNEKDRSDKDE